MNKPFIEIDAEHFTLSAFETKPIEGYEAPTNKDTGQKFPNCCPFHKGVFEGAKSWFLEFPNCCEQHKALVSKWWYDKANYTGIAEKIVKQLSYTEYHISERINIEDWYKDITDYIEYNVSSFGHPAIGLHLYLENLKIFIENPKGSIPEEKRKLLIEFIETYYKSSGETDKTDLNILYNTYQKWLKTFPFDISFFAELKPHFEKQLPILNGKPETNKYTGLAKVKMHTKGSLIDVLLNLTKNLLDKINVPELRKQGAITDIQANQLEFAEAELNTKTVEITKQYSKGELKYVKALKKWLKIHKDFFKEAAPLLKETTTEKIDWIEVFNEIDISKPLIPDAYKTNTIEQKRNYFSKASFNLTIQYLTEFKKNTYLLNTERKLEYIENLNIKKPSNTGTESPEFNQVVFEAQSNYYEFLLIYKDTIKRTSSHQKNFTKKSKPKEFLCEQITHPQRIKIAKAIKDKYNSYTGKDFKILYEALLRLDLFPKKGKRSTFFRCLQNEGYNINNHQLLEDKYFKGGYYNPKGNYEKSDDELQCDSIVEYLEGIINTK